MTRPQLIALALAASALLHGLLLLLMPGTQLRLPITRETLVEVQVAEPTAEQTPPVEEAPPPPELPPEPAPEPEVPSRPPLAAADAAALEKVLSQWSAVSSPPPTAPLPLRLPTRQVELPGAETVTWSPPPPPAEEPLPAGRQYQPTVELPPGPDQQHVQALAESLLQDLAAAAPDSSAQPLATPPQLEIEGPVGRERKVLEQPPLPSVEIRHSADVRLKFFVSPRGEVLRAFPVERGDAGLDRAALAYLKQFRFSPLPHGDQREQWGTIRVRFRLE